jgi:hypothetical protein
MIVTEVEMMMWNPERGETEKMLEWLSVNNKFLFDADERADYGFGGDPWSDQSFWYEDDITVQTACLMGEYIDFRFKMWFKLFPKTLVRILHQKGWKLKSTWREGFRPNELIPDKTKPVKWGDRQSNEDPGFPQLWNPTFDQRRQRGVMPRRDRRRLELDEEQTARQKRVVNTLHNSAGSE